MALISKQVDELRAYANDRKGELAKLISDAADTIELLSAKLSASNIKRSSQYYHGGWIPCSEGLPDEETDVFVCNANGDRAISCGSYSTESKDDFIWYTSGWRFGKVIAWMPLPEPYREGDDE